MKKVASLQSFRTLKDLVIRQRHQQQSQNQRPEPKRRQLCLLQLIRTPMLRGTLSKVRRITILRPLVPLHSVVMELIVLVGIAVVRVHTMVEYLFGINKNMKMKILLAGAIIVNFLILISLLSYSFWLLNGKSAFPSPQADQQIQPKADSAKPVETESIITKTTQTPAIINPKNEQSSPPKVQKETAVVQEKILDPDKILAEYKSDKVTLIDQYFSMFEAIYNSSFNTPEQLCPAILAGTSDNNMYWILVDNTKTLQTKYGGYTSITYIQNNLNGLEGLAQGIKDQCALNGFIIN